MSLLNVGARALMANQIALQTTGHNIANVNTAGYSQRVRSRSIRCRKCLPVAATAWAQPSMT